MLSEVNRYDKSMTINEPTPQNNNVYKELLADREKKIEERESELKEAYKEIGRLESTISQLKKDKTDIKIYTTTSAKLKK